MNILNVKVGKEKTNLDEATIREDGSYYYRIENVLEGYVEVELESGKSKVIIEGQTEKPAKVELPENITEIEIKVIAEDRKHKDNKTNNREKIK